MSAPRARDRAQKETKMYEAPLGAAARAGMRGMDMRPQEFSSLKNVLLLHEK